MQPQLEANPYAPPAAEQSGAQLPLYTLQQIVIATFLGSPLAGAALMALNFRLLDPRRIVATVALGTLATVAVFALAFVLPDRFPNMVLPAAYTGAMALVAKASQGAAIDQALAAGATKGSGWRVAGIAIGALAVVFGLMVGVVMLMPEDKVTFGPSEQQEVYYEDGATEQDARKLGRVLREEGFFTDTPAAVTLKKDGEAWLVTFVLQDGSWNDPEVLRYFRNLRDALSLALGDGEVHIALADDSLTVKKKVDD